MLANLRYLSYSEITMCATHFVFRTVLRWTTLACLFGRERRRSEGSERWGSQFPKEFNTVNIPSHFVSPGEDQTVPHRELRAGLFQETWRRALLGSSLQRSCPRGNRGLVNWWTQFCYCVCRWFVKQIPWFCCKYMSKKHTVVALRSKVLFQLPILS